MTSDAVEWFRCTPSDAPALGDDGYVVVMHLEQFSVMTEDEIMRLPEPIEVAVTVYNAAVKESASGVPGNFSVAATDSDSRTGTATLTRRQLWNQVRPPMVFRWVEP